MAVAHELRADGAPAPRPRWREAIKKIPMKTPSDKLRLVRLALSGALVCMASVGAVNWAFGLPESNTYEVFAGAIGFLVVLGAKSTYFA